jgi:carbonic anhydrase
MAFPNNVARKPYVAVPVPSNFIPAKNEDKQQILWIGCSDSLILETECLEGLREEMFVYRNLGGLVVNGDLSTQSAIEWGIELLKVDHVVVCGHYGCKVVCGKTTEWSRYVFT